jgi:hypothetical protein
LVTAESASTDDQRRRRAVRAKQLSQSALVQIASIVTPDTLFARHRKLIPAKYDGSAKWKPGRPRTNVDAWLPGEFQISAENGTFFFLL